VQRAAARPEDVAHRLGEEGGQHHARQALERDGVDERHKRQHGDDERGGDERGHEPIDGLASALDEQRDNIDQDVEQHRSEEQRADQVELLRAAAELNQQEDHAEQNPAAQQQRPDRTSRQSARGEGVGDRAGGGGGHQLAPENALRRLTA
jgi:hypothetical protein